jgi:hypothetical protein
VIDTPRITANTTNDTVEYMENRRSGSMGRVHPLAALIGTSGGNPYPHVTFIENTPEVLEPAREAVYK